MRARRAWAFNASVAAELLAQTARRQTITAEARAARQAERKARKRNRT